MAFRRLAITLTGFAIATAPGLAMATTGNPAVAAAAPAKAAATGHPLAITHGPAVRNGGVRLAGTRPFSGRGARNATEQSTNWSGYAASGGPYSSVSATWAQPAAKCGSGSQYASFWVGLDGYKSNSVEQVGTDSDCVNGAPQYYGWYEMYPKASYDFGHALGAGDTITASVSFSGTNAYTLTLKDVTKGWTSTTTKKLNNAPRSSAEVIIEAPYSGRTLPLANFGTVSFSDSLVNGTPIGNANPVSIDMVDNSGGFEDHVSPLTGGTSFTGTWVSSD